MTRLVLVLCLAEVLTMTGVFAFAALLPDFVAAWGLSNTEAGWISGIGFAGYALAVPVLTALTDRIDARRVWLGGALLTAASAALFAAFADGLWSALAFRALGGVGLAGTYMPGLKALVDRTEGPSQPRWMSWYTASFSRGTSTSFLISGGVGAAWGWRPAFAAAAAAALAATAVVALALKPQPPAVPVAATPLLDFRPVLRNRPVLGYIFGYAAHTWELFGLRSWMVAFLAFAATLSGEAAIPSPTAVATLAALVAMAASIGGADLAVRFDRRTLCSLAAMASAAMAVVVGISAGGPYLLVVVLILAHNALVQLDSAALTTGAMLEAECGRRGTTIALHSLLGFAGAFAGPLAFGWVLDRAGDSASRGAWALAFVSRGAVAVLGPLALRASRPAPP
ncbi:MAG: MFS transporter [Magnetospirillum sp.]|nr:MFS transporter [Magnetospirillum sp.]